nr:MAG TPA: hypothetical protein [Caudoviricetes sp.]
MAKPSGATLKACWCTLRCNVPVRWMFIVTIRSVQILTIISCHSRAKVAKSFSSCLSMVPIHSTRWG